jgi:glycosyltransferase involved in cell wall biosynthesis
MARKGKEKPKQKLISVVIPAYKAEGFIGRNLLDIKKILDQIRYPYEIICVIDGTSVDKSFDKAQRIARKHHEIKVEGYLTNLGKGHAVRYGMARAKGDVIGFIDAGIELDPNSLSMLLEHFEWYRADIIVGSKRHPASKVIYPWQRRLLSFGYQMIVRILFGLKVKDTQVGMKFFRREVLEKTLPRLLVKAFAFDVEMLSVANYLGFNRIYEAPVNLQMEFKGGVSTIASKGFLRTVFKTFWDTAAVFYRLRLLHYYDEKNKESWITPEYLTFAE